MTDSAVVESVAEDADAAGLDDDAIGRLVDHARAEG